MDVENSKTAVLVFFRKAFEEKYFENALSFFVRAYDAQLNPYVPEDKDRSAKNGTSTIQENAQRKPSFKSHFAHCDRVMLHIHHVFAPSGKTIADAPRGMAGVDIFRLENRKIVKHWDALQRVPAEAFHDNTMF